MNKTLIDNRNPRIAYTGTWNVGGTPNEPDGKARPSVFMARWIRALLALDPRTTRGSMATTSSTSSSPGEQLFRPFDPVAHTLVVLMVPVNSKADGGSENFNVPRAAADSPAPTPRKTTSHIVLIWAVTSGLVALTIAAGLLLIYIPRRRLRRLNSTPSVSGFPNLKKSRGICQC
ncbi:hypothetical protein C8J57DRAFT_1230165 [Mycena rebaudengoi]|nr:hypothetical protein C8J57DRAFT_1230165 [Mycena rebaudengoi]